MTFGHDVFQRGFSAEVLFHASDDHAEISYRHHNDQCAELSSPYQVVYSSGKTGLKQQNYQTLEQAKAAATQFDPTGQWVDLGDVTPDCNGNGGGGDPDDSDPVLGCMDEDATNYNPDATEDDDSCEYDEDEGGSGVGMVPLLIGAVVLAVLVVK
tara:strand:- start:18 stop:482 length:465 start_codon:yes stop_codon:yes gene_type:complete